MFYHSTVKIEKNIVSGGINGSPGSPSVIKGSHRGFMGSGLNLRVDPGVGSGIGSAGKRQERHKEKRSKQGVSK